MKNKKILVLTIVIIMLVSIFASCGNKSSPQTSEDFMAIENSTDAIEGSYIEAEENAKEQTQEDAHGMTSSGEVINVSTKDRKIIYNAYFYIETLEFNKSYDLTKQIIEKSGAFMERSVLNAEGRYRTQNGDYLSEKVYEVDIRVPSENYTKTIEELKTIGTVINLTEDSVDKTSEYTDTVLRKESLQVEADRLLEILANATKIEDIIVLEKRLTAIRQEMELMEQAVRSIDDRVNFSTISLILVEVRDGVYVAPVEASMGQRIKEGFSKSIRSIKYGTENFIITFITAIPYLVLWAVIIALIFFLTRGIIRKVKPKEMEINKIVSKGPEKTDSKDTLQTPPNTKDNNKKQ